MRTRTQTHVSEVLILNYYRLRSNGSRRINNKSLFIELPRSKIPKIAPKILSPYFRQVRTFEIVTRIASF